MRFILLILGLALVWILGRKSKPKFFDASLYTALFVFLILAILLSCFTMIPAGHVGVIDFFGHVSDRTLKSGIHLVNPMAKIIKYSIKTQEATETMDVPSKEGLSIQLDISILFHLNPEKAATVYKTIGRNYEDIVLIPQFRSVARGVTAGYEAKALYTSEREMISSLIKAELQNIVEPRGIIVESVPLRRIILPKGLQDAIEEKLRAEQESQRMQFVLLKEKQEAERKRIEAKGIADFQHIVSQGINEQLLRWKGIEATEKIANSPNTKVVIVGGKDGLPLILDSR